MCLVVDEQSETSQIMPPAPRNILITTKPKMSPHNPERWQRGKTLPIPDSSDRRFLPCAAGPKCRLLEGVIAMRLI